MAEHLHGVSIVVDASDDTETVNLGMKKHRIGVWFYSGRSASMSVLNIVKSSPYGHRNMVKRRPPVLKYASFHQWHGQILYRMPTQFKIEYEKGANIMEQSNTGTRTVNRTVYSIGHPCHGELHFWKNGTHIFRVATTHPNHGCIDLYSNTSDLCIRREYAHGHKKHGRVETFHQRF